MKFSLRNLVHLLLAATLTVGLIDLSWVEAIAGDAASVEVDGCCPSEQGQAQQGQTQQSPDEPAEDDECMKDCSAGCCASPGPAPATLFVAQLGSHSIQTPLLTHAPRGECCRGFGDRVFQPPRA